MATLSDFPGIEQYLDKDAIDTHLEVRSEDGETYVRITQEFSDSEGDQLLFSVENSNVSLISRDNSVSFPEAKQELFLGYSGPMSDHAHGAVAAEAIRSVDVFKTGSGPSHGHRACLWAARRVVHSAVHQWITRQDGTATFYKELRDGGMVPSSADSLPPGAIIIAPTAGKGVGHIGLLGDGNGSDRLVYSNHSPSTTDPVARWKKKYTVGSFVNKMHGRGLKTYFFRLPKPATVPSQIV